MNFTILDHDSTAHLSGAAFRRSRPGPEADMVRAFISNCPFTIPRGCRATIFCEPRIESGFPDIVVVFWSVAVASKWNAERANLTRDDIRLIHHLHQSGPASTGELKTLFSRNPIGNLERLEAAKLLRPVKNRWVPTSLEKSFATRRIIAIEAKIAEWSAALDQAFLNTWFASDSFVLLPQKSPAANIRAAAKMKGIRLCSPTTNIECNRPAFPGKLPRSYASWMFNEWAWRSAELGVGLPS
jgi:hypothetical protein